MSRIFDENPAKRQKRPRVISNLEAENDNLDCPLPPKKPKYKEMSCLFQPHLFQQEQPKEEASPSLVFKL